MADEPTIEEVAAAKARLRQYDAECEAAMYEAPSCDEDPRAAQHRADLRTLLASHASLEDRVKEAERMVVWCRARLKSDAYRATLDRMQSNPVEPDHTPILAAFVNEKET